MTSRLVVIVAVCALGCAETNSAKEIAGADQAAFEATAGDATPERSVPVDMAHQDATGDDAAVAPEVPVWDSNVSQCDPGEGCFLDKCSENEECQSHWCVQHMGESLCTTLCQEECFPGWTCKQVAGTDPDVVYICVSDYANLCRPCAASSDCKSAGGAEDVCVDYGPEGSFCGGSCQDSQDCPWGFSCLDAESAEGVVLNQCVADTGVCPCTENSVAMGLSTPCRVDSEFGTCTGKRVCTDTGLTACDATIPAEEICNGVDDDCDDEVDEPNLQDSSYVHVCEDGNECTEDVCNGDSGCSNAVLESGSCDDENPCTVADHCEMGGCIGDPVECDDQNPCTDNLCTATGGCEYPSNSAPCDDSDPCTLADQCVDGECGGVQVSCGCQVDDDCAALEDGNLCNGVLHCNLDKLPYQCEVTADSVVTCPEPEGPGIACLQTACDPVDGQCKFAPVADGQPCDDQSACTLADACFDGECNGSLPANCADANPCTEDFCDPETGCVHLNSGLSCQDGDACTVGDTCLEGECVSGAVKDCNDSNPCTNDACDPVAGCVHNLLAGSCDDGNQCTTDDKCVNGICTGSGIMDCDDANNCTKDLCLPGGGCSHVAVVGPCDDGNGCTLFDYCQNGDCVPGQQKICDDSNDCTTDSCVGGICLFASTSGDCDDQSACTADDACINGQCVGQVGVDCDDSNPCTSEHCDPAVGCVYSLNGNPCDDGNPCTTVDACNDGGCTGGEPLDCDDDNECTLDNCSPDVGCKHTPWESGCDDNNPCTTGDLCDQGLCIGQAILECDDGNPCTQDYCDPVAGGCDHLPTDGFCSDADACTMNDFCKNGTCVGGPAVNCNDDNPCTNDSCDSGLGCLQQVNSAPCDDLNPCTVGDECANGECGPGPDPLNCNDGDECTDDSCVPETGCSHTHNTAQCDDNNACTQDDACADGICKPGQPIQCPDDGDTCTAAECLPDQGCIQKPVAPCCGNGVHEQGEECDDGNNVNDDGCSANCVKESQCEDVGNDKLIYVSELNSCLAALGAQFSAVQYIEVAYGHTDYLDNICDAMGYQSYNGCHGGDQCGGSAKMYPSHCGQGWLGGPCHNGCGNVNYDAFYCK